MTTTNLPYSEDKLQDLFNEIRQRKMNEALWLLDTSKTRAMLDAYELETEELRKARNILEAVLS